MYVTLSVSDIAIGLVLLALFGLIIYIALFFKNLIVTLKKTNEILTDVKGITKVAEKRTSSIDNMVDNIIDSMGEDGRDEGILKQVSNIAAAINNIFKIASGKNREEKKEK